MAEIKNTRQDDRLLSAPADYFLDITRDHCPMTFVKVRVQLDRMRAGERLEVRLKGAEPLRNVPRAAAELGHDVAGPAPEPDGGDAHRLLITKA